MNKQSVKIGVIGGSGFDDPKIFTDYKIKEVETPYGHPASALTLGKINNREVVVIARHGKEHVITPTNVPFRANIWALKEERCTHILATTACGSLREEIRPGDLVFLDQFIDNTKHRILTFFEDTVIHTPMAEPFDKSLRGKLINAAEELNFSFHPKGAVITIEGPRFSTKAESKMFRTWGADVVNMSTVPEVILANELGILYQSIAMSTDYDCWKEDEKPVTFEMIIERMKDNAEKVKKLLVKVISEF